jgi:hypothetical protein
VRAGIWRNPIGNFLKSRRNSKSVSSIGARTETLRSLGTLAIAWQRLSLLPPESLTRAGAAGLAKYRHGERETEVA